MPAKRAAAAITRAEAGGTARGTSGGSSGSSGNAAPAPVFEHPLAGQAIIAALRQRGNPFLSRVRATMVEFVDGLVPDYLAGPQTAVIFISLRFHLLHADYLQRRVDALRDSSYRARVLLCRVDVANPEDPLRQVTLTAFHGKLSLLLAWTDAEAAAYLETLHRYQSKGAEVLMKKLSEGDHRARMTEVLTTVKAVNKADATALMTHFGTFTQLATASEEELQGVQGIGSRKVRELKRVFHEPFFP